MEIEVGDYIRTKSGIIRKAETIKSGKRQFTRTTETLINGKFKEEIESAEVEIESNTIKDVDKFVFKLKADNLYSPEIQEFLISYMQFYNN